MRPVMLDMHGFASFREPTRVDFADADFFALVGPTGSGKSTVIDAMTFALYGSVPRWARKGTVSLALAPTVDRGTVKLVFEVGHQRYAVARELRRTGTRVTQRAATLERLAAPDGLAEPGEQTVPLAKDVDGVTETVQNLLGLSYEDFTQCVVLPQGDFQKFLHAKPAERQEILLRLLGAENYKQMMSLANQRAASAELRAATIGETLRGYEDATGEALAAAVAREEALDALSDTVSAAMPPIAEARAALAAADEKLRALRAEHEMLSSVSVPPGTETIDAELSAAREGLADLRTAERTAEETDTAARDALASGPKRTPLEVARERRAERARIAGSAPDLESAVSDRSDQAAAAAAAVTAAERDVERTRERRDTATRATETANQRLRDLQDEHAILSGVTVPDGAGALDSTRAAAAEALEAAARELEEAETAEAAAAEARAAAGPQAPLLRALGELDQLRDLVKTLHGHRQAATRARTRQDEADQAVADAEKTHAERRTALEDARRAHVIEGLRPHLEVGEACPLCEQTVATLPGTRETMSAGKAARAASDEAEAALKRAQEAAGAARAQTVRAESALESGESRGNELRASLGPALDGPLTEDNVARARAEAAGRLKDHERVEREADQAVKSANTARTRHRRAQDARAKADQALARAREELRDTRDPLVRFGAPAPGDGITLARAWEDLAEWSRKQASDRAAGLAEAREAERTVRADQTARTEEFARADSALARARQHGRAAEAAEQKARAALSAATARIAELEDLLADAPADDEITRRLEELDRLEQRAGTAAKALRDARAARAEGEENAAAKERVARDEHASLSAARDRVVSLGAPALDGAETLVEGWTRLVTWAGEQAEARERDMAQASAAADRARSEMTALAGRLAEDLVAAGITVDSADAGAVAERAPSLVAAAREKARAATERVKERQAEAAGLVARQKEATEDQRVAKLLGDLLRANAFQRWLVTAALDDLVTHASATLNDLSSGQFDLAYDDGDFYVIDHADADASRSVRTLSGGETFQASLALALALSSQISALSAAGAARLDSIFLDEGFGTLDPETLEVVATTLETLAQGDRMVGVVTHVGALAERVPVRFRVSRDARTSLLTREGPDIAMEELG
ncbi:MAG: SMC family ATPase [Streptosporangiales bacterium]|nr:SMC family ATPase [Streptosporangiales bacterium]